jgi:hypothetical protein
MKRLFVAILIGAISGLVGGIALALLTVYLSGFVTGLHDLSYWVAMFDSLLPVAVLLCGLVGTTMASPLRHKAVNSKQKMSAVIFAALLLIASCSLKAWLTLCSPQFYLRAIYYSDNHDPHIRAIYVKKLAALGSRAVAPVVDEIRKNGTRSRGTWQLNVALKGLGQPAHHQLVAAIDKETDPWKRVHLIDSLQESFGDFSRVHLWLKLAKQYPFTANHIRLQLLKKYQDDVPFIFADEKEDKINPQFVKWYRSQMVPKGSLPRWQP